MSTNAETARPKGFLLRLPAPLRAELEELAREDRRSLNAYITLALTREVVRETGLDPHELLEERDER